MRLLAVQGSLEADQEGVGEDLAVCDAGNAGNEDRSGQALQPHVRAPAGGA